MEKVVKTRKCQEDWVSYSILTLCGCFSIGISSVNTVGMERLWWAKIRFNVNEHSSPVTAYYHQYKGFRK